mmetsp:Transcript_15661/g.22293  ORF Transcript_15661/g.22293 Transcript_15661/m.22293 type:complete len:183 (-) Transcript_15661:1370-1918(-)
MHYRNESSFLFEKYSTRLKNEFTTLSNYNHPKSEGKQVEILLDHINRNDARLTTSIGIYRNQHAATFEDACMYLSKEIVTIYPQHQPNVFGKRGKGGKKPQVRGINSIKTKQGKVTCNGVDMTDTTKYFSKFEFNKMGKKEDNTLINALRGEHQEPNIRIGKSRKEIIIIVMAMQINVRLLQ